MLGTLPEGQPRGRATFGLVFGLQPWDLETFFECLMASQPGAPMVQVPA